jgi:HD-GYP domain-containing protein (c-di-GMP phosphodiesterase class II)
MTAFTNFSLDFSREFASKLVPAFQSPFAIGSIQRASDTVRIDLLEHSGPEDSYEQSLQSDLDQLAFLPKFSPVGIATISIEPNRAILAIDASERRDGSIALFLFAPDASDTLIETLVTAVRSQVEFAFEKSSDSSDSCASRYEEGTESFIEQITQDFEELTWLRQSHRFADLYSVKASSVELAHTCVSSMTQVIQAESLLFLEISGLNVQSTVAPSKIHVLAGPPVDFTAWELDQWLHELTERGRTSPILLDSSVDARWLKRFPHIRNCMLTVVSKGERIFGWLIAINKLIPIGPTSDQERKSFADLYRPRFGTFEAGLLTTAANMLASQASNSELFAAQEELTKGLVLAIINAIDAKDCYTAGHSERVASFSHAIASRMGLTPKECDRIHMAGLLHDVGKIGIPDSILKKPDKLTDEEFQFVKAHPVIGYSILKHLNSIDYVLPGVLYHHEAFNGSGYPQGLQGNAIPLMARILAVSDAFDAMTSTRAYRKALSLEEAMQILGNGSSKTWDTEIVNVLFECIRDEIILPGKVAVAMMVSRNPISMIIHNNESSFTNDLAPELGRDI